jgi:ABC-type multidrug transport system ATPase subunit
MRIIEVKNLNFTFENQKIYENLNFTIEKGQKTAITGISGSGKTTLFNILLGFLPIENGEIIIFGKKLNYESIKKIRSKTSWLPQQVDIYYNTVKELFYSPFELKQNKIFKPTIKEIENILNKIDLEISLLDKNINEISGGQKQRLVICSLLLLKKDIFFLDEPTSALDDNSIEKVFDLIYSQKDTTFLFATHNNYWIKKSDLVIEVKSLK